MQESPLFSTPSPAFVVCRFFDDGHSDLCEVISHCSFVCLFKSLLFSLWVLAPAWPLPHQAVCPFLTGPALSPSLSLLSLSPQLCCLYQALSPVSLCICLSLILCLSVSNSMPLRLHMSSSLSLPSPIRRTCPTPLRGCHPPVPPPAHYLSHLHTQTPTHTLYPQLTGPYLGRLP